MPMSRATPTPSTSSKATSSPPTEFDGLRRPHPRRVGPSPFWARAKPRWHAPGQRLHQPGGSSSVRTGLAPASATRRLPPSASANERARETRVPRRSTQDDQGAPSEARLTDQLPPPPLMRSITGPDADKAKAAAEQATGGKALDVSRAAITRRLRRTRVPMMAPEASRASSLLKTRPMRSRSTWTRTSRCSTPRPARGRTTSPAPPTQS